MKPGVSGDRRCMIKLDDEFPIPGLSLLLIFRRFELSHLPGLPLVLAEVLHNKWLNVFNTKKALSRRVNSKTTKIARNPATPQFLSHCCRSTATTEAVENKTAFI